jgi:hypothetical protein
LLDGLNGKDEAELSDDMRDHIAGQDDDRDDDPDTYEDDGTDPDTYQFGPNDLPYGGMPLQGGGQTPIRQSPLSQDGVTGFRGFKGFKGFKGAKGFARDDMAFDEAFPEVARIKTVPDYGAPSRKRRREPAMSREDEARFARMFPEVARLGR